MPNQLLSDRYSPITSEIGFLECNAETAKDAYLNWMQPIQAERNIIVEGRNVGGDFVSKICSLLPLTSIERRRSLFVPTKSDWTAYFDNGWQGTDAFTAVSYLSQEIGCRGIRAVSILNTIEQTRTGLRGRYGATIFELYASSTDGCSFLNTQRSVFAANDGGRWKFGAAGGPLEFEDVKQYESRRIQDRFNPEMLDRYLRSFGIQLFLEEFYSVNKPAQLVVKEGPCAAGMKSYSLAEAQSEN